MSRIMYKDLYGNVCEIVYNDLKPIRQLLVIVNHCVEQHLTRTTEHF